MQSVTSLRPRAARGVAAIPFKSRIAFCERPRKKTRSDKTPNVLSVVLNGTSLTVSVTAQPPSDEAPKDTGGRAGGARAREAGRPLTGPPALNRFRFRSPGAPRRRPPPPALDPGQRSVQC
ncbi:hypothetical protein EVAR_29607_1 [Eumeta japonica]|uniref:Uncharacterized protein n=1 Tax=Eumeta variegata TaxID=151549 RepID=A0A4C1VUY9_EUMVA|nr:hypothetical protein EVAR_29607_1 [Eumeta japonica]